MTEKRALYQGGPATDRRHVDLTVEPERLRLMTTDVGDSPRRIWGDDDYEFWTEVPAAAWPKLLSALLAELYRDDPEATDKLRELCRREGVPHQWASWV